MLTLSDMSKVYLHAANLHLRLSAFFDPPSSKHYWEDLLALWTATTTFLEHALHIELPAPVGGGRALMYVSNYILQMIIAAGFTLLKLLNSFFASHIDLEYGKTLFNRTIWAIREISVTTNDLPSRLAEVLAQLWRGGGAGHARTTAVEANGNGPADSSLQLKVRCRMSVSHVFDAVWRWREDYQAKGRGNLECKRLLPPLSRYCPRLATTMSHLSHATQKHWTYTSGPSSSRRQEPHKSRLRGGEFSLFPHRRGQHQRQLRPHGRHLHLFRRRRHAARHARA